MNFYWFGRTESLSELSLELEDSGFKGVLLPYGSDIADYIVQVARSINVNQKLKYIIAIRPYTISPQHLGVIIKSLNSIDSDRVWINFVSGQIIDEEKAVGGILGDINDSSTQNQRRMYLEKYVPAFFDFCKKLNIKTKICISGMGKDIASLVDKYGDYSFAAYEPYSKDEGIAKTSKPRVLSMFPLIEDDPEIFNKLKNSKELEPDIKLTTTNELIKIISDIKLDGINDLMFYCYWSEKYKDRIVDFVKQNNHLFV
jgi:hypothetical protein